MPRYEYKVVPAPRKGQRAKGLRGADQKFANALQGAMNLQAADGWEYLRTDTLPCEERHGLSGKTTVFQNMLVFRRALAEDLAATPEPAAIADTTTAARPLRPVRLDPPVAAPAPAQPDGADETDEADGSARNGPGNAPGQQPA